MTQDDATIFYGIAAACFAGLSLIAHSVPHTERSKSHVHKMSTVTQVYIDNEGNENYDRGVKTTTFEDGCTSQVLLPENTYLGKTRADIEEKLNESSDFKKSGVRVQFLSGTAEKPAEPLEQKIEEHK